MMETEETIILVTLDELECALIREFLDDWKDKTDLSELTDFQIDRMDEAIQRLLKKVGND